MVAKLATRRAKPNGQHYVSMEDIDTFILDKPVRDLPGKKRAHPPLYSLIVTTTLSLKMIPSLLLKKIFEKITE